MRVDFNEISKLRDSKLILETLTAILNKASSIDEKRKIYSQIFTYYKHSKLKLRADFFIKFAQILFEEQNYDLLKDLARNCYNFETHQIFIDLGINLGKIQDVIEVEKKFLTYIQNKGLNKQVVGIIDKLELLVGMRPSLELLKLQALLGMGNEQALCLFLKRFREEHLVKSQNYFKENPLKRKSFLDIFEKIKTFPYRSQEYYMEQCRWILLRDIIQSTNSAKNLKKALDLLVLTENTYDYCLLTAYFSNINDDLGSYLRVFTKNQKDFSTLSIIKNFPLFLKYFKDHIGSYIRNKKSGQDVFIDKPQQNSKKQNHGFDQFIYQLGINQHDSDYATKIEKCFFDWIKEDSVELKQLNFYDLLILLKDLNFTDAMEQIFWIGDEKKLTGEKERYLVGKVLMEHNKFSKAHNILAYCDSPEGKDLLKKVYYLKNRAQDV